MVDTPDLCLLTQCCCCSFGQSTQPEMLSLSCSLWGIILLKLFLWNWLLCQNFYIQRQSPAICTLASPESKVSRSGLFYMWNKLRLMQIMMLTFAVFRWRKRSHFHLVTQTTFDVKSSYPRQPIRLPELQESFPFLHTPLQALASMLKIIPETTRNSCSREECFIWEGGR